MGGDAMPLRGLIPPPMIFRPVGADSLFIFYKTKNDNATVNRCKKLRFCNKTGIYCTFFVAFLLLCEIIRNFEPPNVLKENMNFLFVSLIY
jgi:hypothetical protein